MNMKNVTIKCDACGEVLDASKEDYIPGVSFTYTEDYKEVICHHLCEGCKVVIRTFIEGMLKNKS